MYEELQKKIEEIEEEFIEIKNKTSEIRKKGLDTHFVEVKLLNMTPKLRMFKATGDKKDEKILHDMINDIRFELITIEDGEGFEFTLHLLDKIGDNIYKGRVDVANELLKEFEKLWLGLSKDQQQLLDPTRLHILELLNSQ